MVAYSSAYCLPCFEAGDSPCVNTGTVCDPSTVFCDLVDIVEFHLNALDATVARTTEAIPLASVTGVAGTAATVPVTVEFDTVEYDTDNMVNLDLDPTVISPTRDGFYMVFAEVITNAEAAPADGFERKITVFSDSNQFVGVTPEVSVYTGSIFIHTQQPIPFVVGVNQPFSLQYTGDNNNFNKARMTVWWVSDL